MIPTVTPSHAKSSRLGRWLRSLANHDFFPGFSAKARHILYNPLGVLLLAAAASLLCGLFLHAQGFILCGGVLSVVALGIVWPWLSLRGLSGTLAFDRYRASEGDAVSVSLRLRNRLLWSAWGLAVRGGFGDDPGTTVAGVASTPGRRTAICRWIFTPTRRGVYPLMPTRLASGFPFGLWEVSRGLAVERSLLVWPRTFPVGPIPAVRGDRQVEGNVSRNKVGNTGDVLGVRPYRRGDSPRRIHWGQSARHDRLIVCEIQSNARPVIQLVLDANPRIHSGTGAEGSREWAIRIVASLAKGWLEAGAQVGLAYAGFDIPAASGIVQIHKILDVLALLPEAVDSSLREVLACPKCQGFRDGLQVIVTTDRAHRHTECAACAADDQHWVVLSTTGFADAIDVIACPCEQERHPEPWLRIDTPELIPALLRGGWREARHGS
ncbi:MAG TPA: DUF58 domain-containing protein [Gemmata sp.]|nr:DUF58 domain-containing protein [Gemmata sp.]